MRLLVLRIVFIVVFIPYGVLFSSSDIKFSIPADSPVVSFGVSDLRAAIGHTEHIDQAIRHVVVEVGTDSKDTKGMFNSDLSLLPNMPESFLIVREDQTILILGSDETGAMYGCLELAERLDMNGLKALKLEKPIIQSPYVEFRGVNQFMILPYGHEEVNPDNWWFYSDDFWSGYLDMLARARINWIDFHGSWSIETEICHNIFGYFVKSQHYPQMGVPADMARKNLDMLNQIIKMAKDRGIRFAIMSYDTQNGPYFAKQSLDDSPEKLSEYMAECVTKLIDACPDLAMIGFRKGDTGRSDDFFNNIFAPALKKADKPIHLYGRSWGAAKSKVVELARQFPEKFYLEIKYNGEHYGPSHIVQGGRTTKWGSYFYQDFLSYPKPYKVVWQVRAGGTHRVFAWGNPDFVARTARNSKIGGAHGISVEPINAYLPAYDYLHKQGSSCKWYDWMYQRDWFFYDVWGRMSYNPNLSKDIWLKKFEKHYGAEFAEPLYKAFTTASQIVPYGYMFHCLSPDHRFHVPELETGGDIRQWAYAGPLDTANVQSPIEFAERLKNGNPSARMSPIKAANWLAYLSESVIAELEVIESKTAPQPKELRCLVKELKALTRLGLYYAYRLRSATAYANYVVRYDPNMTLLARWHHHAATTQWQNLAEICGEHFTYFPEILKLRTEYYSWHDEGRKLKNELKPLEDYTREIQEKGLKFEGRGIESWEYLEPKGDRTGPAVELQEQNLTLLEDGNKQLSVSVEVRDPAGVQSVLFKYKPMPSEQDWRIKPMILENGLWTAAEVVTPDGFIWAIEALDNDDNGTTWPDFRYDIPYRWIDPWENDIESSKSKMN